MGDVTFHLVYFGKAHSDSDILIYIPEENLLMSGDLFNSGGSGNLSRLNHNEVGKVDIDRWCEALNFILQPDNKIEKVIPLEILTRILMVINM
jgi:glyoxylase-like metal-dependent hydrolase (beta-lactamase superfamily II)